MERERERVLGKDRMKERQTDRELDKYRESST